MFQRPRLSSVRYLPDWLIVLVFVAGLPGFSAQALGQQNDLKQVAASLARDINAANRKTVTVADFTDLQGNVTELGRFIAEELSTQLVIDAKSFTIVERIQLAAILKEHQISISGLVEPATIRKLGQFAGVDAIVTGTLVPFSDSVRLTAKVLDVSTAKVVAVSTAELPRTKAIDDLLSRGITTVAMNDQGNPGQPRPTSSVSQPHSVVQDDFLFVIKSCIRRGDRISCSGSVTNKADKPRNLGLWGGGWTTAVDNKGNSYVIEQLHMGQRDGANGQQLMSDLPVNFFIDLPGVDATATQISVVLGYGGDGIGGTKVLFRDIALAQK